MLLRVHNSSLSQHLTKSHLAQNVKSAEVKKLCTRSCKLDIFWVFCFAHTIFLSNFLISCQHANFWLLLKMWLIFNSVPVFQQTPQCLSFATLYPAHLIHLCFTSPCRHLGFCFSFFFLQLSVRRKARTLNSALILPSCPSPLCSLNYSVTCSFHFSKSSHDSKPVLPALSQPQVSCLLLLKSSAFKCTD